MRNNNAAVLFDPQMGMHLSANYPPVDQINIAVQVQLCVRGGGVRRFYLSELNLSTMVTFAKLFEGYGWQRKWFWRERSGGAVLDRHALHY
jgi:hypothetical protein